MAGKDNIVADALSRMWACSISTISVVHKDWINDIQEEYLLDEQASKMMKEFQQGKGEEYPNFK